MYIHYVQWDIPDILNFITNFLYFVDSICVVFKSLAECTERMDSTTWNGYQIVNNRARSLCYATQQQQFRKLAEVTVNQLMSQALGQLEYLQQLQVVNNYLIVYYVMEKLL